MRKSFRTAILAGAALTLAACNQPAETDEGEGADDLAEAVEDGADGSTGVRSDAAWLQTAPGTVSAGSPAGDAENDDAPLLDVIDTSAGVDLGGAAGGCAFAHQGYVLFIAANNGGPNGRGMGIAQIAGSDITLTGSEAGGADYIESGPSMTNGETTITVDRAEGGAESISGGARRWAAELRVQEGLEPARVYRPGTWTCGT